MLDSLHFTPPKSDIAIQIALGEAMQEMVEMLDIFSAAMGDKFVCVRNPVNPNYLHQKPESFIPLQTS